MIAATASYILRPRAPLGWLDPGVFGTLGVGAGFALGAVTAAISNDGRISVAEAELLRTICGVLHCPLPPMLERS